MSAAETFKAGRVLILRIPSNCLNWNLRDARAAVFPASSSILFRDRVARNFLPTRTHTEGRPRPVITLLTLVATVVGMGSRTVSQSNSVTLAAVAKLKVFPHRQVMLLHPPFLMIATPQ
jgi:hypothetical protein